MQTVLAHYLVRIFYVCLSVIEVVGGMSFLKVSLLIGLAVSVAGCAQDTIFLKDGTTSTQLKLDSDDCWKKAQAVEIDKDTQAVTAAISLLIGGPGALIGNAMAQNDPKAPHRREAHDKCMKERGYHPSKAKAEST